MGRPVKVMLTREDQFNFGHPKTISHQRFKAAIRDDQSLALQKRIQAVKHELVAAPGSPGPMPTLTALAPTSIKDLTAAPVATLPAITSTSGHVFLIFSTALITIAE